VNKSLVASVRARLKNVFDPNVHKDNMNLLKKYALERLLYKLSQSQHAEQFVLKGAMLFSLWADTPHRTTQDIDLLGYGDIDIAAMEKAFRDICAVPDSDSGLEFDPESVKGEDIKDMDLYNGIRIKMKAMLGNSPLVLQVDIGFGDAVVIELVEEEYPTLLDLPAPKVKAYQKQTVIAEKVEAMVDLGFDNSRMKDFFDINHLVEAYDLNTVEVTESIRSTFERRGTEIPSEVPVALTDQFYDDEGKVKQWAAFVKKKAPQDAPDLRTVMVNIKDYVMPIFEGIKEKTD